ncbi:protein of unknown function [Bartonella clarridgeiae 73]|uniref:Uncharacterized protein n=1 Tax=Bartonella clarridgeiae (strain CCUG 45776 / CIP 104772 / 73) TaxID=696125 RepID=E6YHC7_BARC7|nr:protein of unknown function [Bartonella clarridgeiae 73]
MLCLYCLHNYRSKGVIHFQDIFQLEAFCSTLESGLDVEVEFSNNGKFYNDLL